VKLRVVRGKQSVVIDLTKAEVKEVVRAGVDPSKLEAEAQQALLAGEKDDAVRILKQLAEQQPGVARLRRDLAFAELMCEDIAHAKEDYARAAALDSFDVEALMGLGYTCTRTADRDGAIDAYRKATAAGPRHTR